MDSKMAKQILDVCRTRHQSLVLQLKDIGFLWPGSVTSRYLTCGKPTCVCHKDPASRHGPYLYWSSKVRGKTVSKAISGADATIIQQWVANRVRLESIVEQMKHIAQEAYEAAVLLQKEDDGKAPQ